MVSDPKFMVHVVLKVQGRILSTVAHGSTLALRAIQTMGCQYGRLIWDPVHTKYI